MLRTKIDKNNITIEKKFPKTSIENRQILLPSFPEKCCHKGLVNIIPKK